MKKLLFILSIFFVNLSFAQSDCISAMPVCGNSAISYNPQNAGTIAEATSNSCLALEHYSVWYTFTVATSGTLTFTISPDVQTDDYDFALYGPNINCLTHDFGNAIRCNFSGADGDTGLGNGATNPDGGGGGAPGQWSSPLNVLAGEVYYLLVDNYVPSTLNGFDLTWGGTAALTSPFNATIQPNPFIAPGINHDGNVLICASPQIFDFSTLSAGILNSNPNFSINYYANSNDAITGNSPITTPISVNSTNVYYYAISYTDPANPTNPANTCKEYGEIHFIQGNITVNNATLQACNNNNAGTATFDLTSVSAAMFADPTATRKYYPSQADMNGGTNQIANPAAYVSAAPASVYVKVTTTQGCSNYGVITLQFYPVVVMNDASLTTCFIEANPSTGLFNLNLATVGGGAVTKLYYPSYTDAVNGTNAIPDPSIFISPNTIVYVKGTNANGCTGISKITLNVTPPKYSTVLKDKIICAEDTTTLDAGDGFTAYLWSTGAATQSISNVSIGTYWVDLTLNDCVTRQTVTVSASSSPIVSGIEITNNTITISVTGGTPPYKYSMDNLLWQDSNSFTNVPRGMNTIYVKDSYDCEPIAIEVTVPNLVNVITPNNDGVNDVIDYSALAYKQNLIFNIFDRYGNKVHQADKSNGYKWDGRFGDRKIYTGTYWYSVTWNESDPAKTPVKFSGWVLVKNRE